MLDWKYREGSSPLKVLEDTGVNGCPIISVSTTGHARCHNQNGDHTLPGWGNFDLVKRHPCSALKGGDLVMVWDTLGEQQDAVLRRFKNITVKSQVQVYPIPTCSQKNIYSYALPLDIWKEEVGV